MAAGAAVPPPDDRAKILYSMFLRAKAFRQDYEDEWDRALRWFKGNQRSLVKEGWQANSVNNQLWRETWTVVPFVGGRVQDVQCKARNLQLNYLADELSTLISRVYRDNEAEIGNLEMVFAETVFGIGWWKFWWDPRGNGGQGCIRRTTVPTRAMYIQPHVQKYEDACVVYEARTYDKLTALRRFPNVDRKVIDSIFRRDMGPHPLDDINPPPGEDMGVGRRPRAPGDVNPTDTTSFFAIANQMRRDRHTITVIEAHFLDSTAMEVKEETEKKAIRDAKLSIAEDRRRIEPRYPNGRIVCFTDKYVLEDRDEPFPGFPYVAGRNVFIENHPYAIGDVSVALEIQKGLNESNNMTFDATKRSYGRSVLAGARAEIELDLVTGDQDEVVPCNDPTDTKELTRGRVPPGAYAIPDRYRQYMQDVFGTDETLRGQVSDEIRSGFAVELLQQSAAVRMKMKTISLESVIRNGSKFITHMIAAQYRPGIEFEAGNALALADIFQISGESNESRAKRAWRKISPDMFEYVIRAGINLRQSRAADIQFFQWMLSEGLIDEEYFVEHADLPGKTELILRKKPEWDAKKQALMAQAQAAQAQAASPGQAA